MTKLLKKLTVPLGILSLSVLLTSSCGGGSSEGVTPPPPPKPAITSVTVSCGQTTVSTGQTSQCTATVTGTGAISSAVSWSVSNKQGGDSTVGTVSSSGLYTAPAAVPTPYTVTVTATSTSDATKFGSASMVVAGTIASVTQFVVASEGATIGLPDGSSVTIAAGALPADQLLTLSEVSYLPYHPLNPAITTLGPALVLSFDQSVQFSKTIHAEKPRTIKSAGTSPGSLTAFHFVTSTAQNSVAGLIGSVPAIDFVDTAGISTFVGAAGSFAANANELTVDVGFDILGGIQSATNDLIAFATKLERTAIHVFTAPNRLAFNKATYDWTNYSDYYSSCTTSSSDNIPTGRTLLVVHGMLSFVQDSFPAKDQTIQKIKQSGNYDSVVGFDYDWTQAIDISGGQLADFLNDLSQCTSITELDVEAHSEGVPVSMYAIAHSNAKVAHLIALGGPIMGTPIANDARLFHTYLMGSSFLELGSNVVVDSLSELLGKAFIQDLQVSTPLGGDTLDTIRTDFAVKTADGSTNLFLAAGSSPSTSAEQIGGALLYTTNGISNSDGIIPVASALAFGAGFNDLKVYPLFPYPTGHTGLISDLSVEHDIGIQASNPETAWTPVLEISASASCQSDILCSDPPGTQFAIFGSSYAPGNNVQRYALYSDGSVGPLSPFSADLGSVAWEDPSSCTTPPATLVYFTQDSGTQLVSNAVTEQIANNSCSSTTLSPTITSLSPSYVTVGSGAFTLTIYGSGFLSGSSVSIGQETLKPALISPGQLQVSLSSSDVMTVGEFPVSVTNPDSSVSNQLPFNVTAASGVSVAINPASVQLAPAWTQVFAATVTGSSNENVTWTVQEGTLGGTIDSSGLYVAPSSAGTFHVVATSQADPTKTAVATAKVVTGSLNAPRFVFVANGDTTISRFLVDQTTGQIRSSGAISLGPYAQTGGVDVTPDGRFAYVADYSGIIYGFNLQPDGTLLPMVSSPFIIPLSSSGLVSINVHPSGKFLYVSDDSHAALWIFSIDGSTGSLSLVQQSPTLTGSVPSSAAFDPTGSHLFIANTGDNTLSAFSVNLSTGTLTPMSGSPFYAGPLLPLSVAVDASGRFVYCLSLGTIEGYSIDDTNNTLNGIGSWAGVGSSGLAVDGLGRYLYAAGSSGGVSSFTIDPSTGALTATSGSPFAVGLGANQNLMASPSGNYLYAVQASSVAVLRVDQSSGVLTAINSILSRDTLPPLFAPKQIALGKGPTGIQLLPAFAFVTNSGSNSVSGFSVDPTTGLLARTGFAIQTGANPQAIATDRLGRFLYVANEGENTVSAFTINGSTGSLTSVAGSPYPTGDQPVSLTMDAGGQFLYVANAGGNSISEFKVNRLTGELTGAENLDVYSVGCAAPQSLAVDPRGYRLHIVCGGSSRTLSVPIDPDSGAPFIGSVFFAQQNAVSIGFHPSGQFLYLLDPANLTADEFTVSQAGVLTSGPAGPTGVDHSLSLDPLGRFLYATSSTSGSVQGDSVNPTGSLTQVSGSPFSVGPSPNSLTVDPSGKYVYVVNGGSNAVSLFKIDSSTGGLSSLGNPAAVGSAPTGIVVTPKFQ